MSAVTTGQVISADGTAIVFNQSGAGPGIVLVHGAFTDRSPPTLAQLADALAPRFTVFNYDRRGRGESGDTQPCTVQREVEDLAALIRVAGSPAMVFGGSSGAALALRAAAQIPAISRLALWEPPYHVGPGAPGLPLLTGVTQPTIVLTGGDSPGWMTGAGRAVAEKLSAGTHRVLAGQTHNVAPQVIVPELLRFFA